MEKKQKFDPTTYSVQNDNLIDDLEPDNSNQYMYIDTDVYSYISNLIMQLSRLITHGKGISTRGVNALLLFFLCAALISENTTFPKDNYYSILKLYWIPLAFLLYVVYDLLMTYEFTNNYLKKIYQRTDYISYKINSGDITQSDLEFYAKILSFNKKQLISIINSLYKRDFLTYTVQINLLKNDSIYTLEKLTHIKLFVLRYKWSSDSICAFIKRTKNNLSNTYIDDLIHFYEEYPSVKFALGHYQKYEDENDIHLNLGKNFHCDLTKFETRLLIFKGMYFASALIFAFFVIRYIYQIHVGTGDSQLLIYSAIFLVTIIISSALIMWNDGKDFEYFEKKITEYLNEESTSHNLSEKDQKMIIEDLLSAF